MFTPTTQVCTSCEIEKDQSEFHRRGRGFHKACKVCRNAEERKEYQAPSRTPRIAKKINPNNFPAVTEHILKLEKRIRQIARSFANDALDADDIYAEITEDILTLCKPEDTDAYLLQRARLTAMGRTTKQNTYNQYVEGYDELEGDEEVIKQNGWHNDESPHEIENWLMRREVAQHFEEVISSLPIENQKVVTMLSIGMNQREIAVKLNISEQSISERMKRIRVFISSKFDLDVELLFA